MTHGWDPTPYERFQKERSQPSSELFGLGRACPGMRIPDRGCGTGEPTQHLHSDLQARETVGGDRSEVRTPYREALPRERHGRFLNCHRHVRFAQLDDPRPFFYPFRRLFWWAQH